MIVSIIWFIVILSVLVISHEMGHFLIARAHGIRVKEFAIGLGPTICGFTKGETKFSLKLLPIGGACIFDGMDGMDPDAQYDERSFPNAKVWHRISTVLAGPVFNFILAMIFAMIIVGICGTDLPVVSGLTEGRPAQAAGMEVGDTITEINGERIHVWRDISLISILNSGETLEIGIIKADSGNEETVFLTPVYDASENRYFIGIEGGNVIVECKGWDFVKYSYYELLFNFRDVLKSLKQLVMGKLSKDAIAGPVGIAQVVDESYDVAKEYGASTVVLTMMNLAMILSVNLGVVNLLPLPAIDGGRLVFLLIEVIRGKPVPPEKEGIVHLIGIILLLILMVFILFNDISRFFR